MSRLLATFLDTTRRETRLLLALALPIFGAQLAQAGMSVADVMMTGRLSATDLAAVSVGSSLWLPLMLFMTGTLMGLTPIVAQLLGGRRIAEITPNVHQGLWVALALGVLAAGLLWFAVGPIFILMDVPEAVAERSRTYLFAVAFGIAFCLVVALINSLLLRFTAEPVIGLYTRNTEVAGLALSLVLLAMIYQVSDSLQVNLAGALRGYKDTRIIMAITLASYWLVGMAGGHWLGTRGVPGLTEPLGVHGYWIGLIAGLTAAAAMLGERLRRIGKAVTHGERDPLHP